MDVQTKKLLNEIPTSTVFASDVILIDNTREIINQNLELWKGTKDSKQTREVSPQQDEWLYDDTGHCSNEMQIFKIFKFNLLRE